MATLTITGVPGAIADAITARLDPPPLDTVVAGVDGLPTGAFLDIEQRDWEATVAGARAAFLFAQAEAARLVAAGEPGRIVFLVPTSSVRVVQGASLLSTAGAFLTTTAQVGAVELGPTGVTVNVVACRLGRGRGGRPGRRRAGRAPGAAGRRRRRRGLPGLRGGGLRQRRDARRRRRLLDLQDRRRLAPPALTPMRLSLTDNTFRLLHPWERVLDLARLLEVPAVDVCIMGARSHLRPEDIRDDIPRTAERIAAGLAERSLALSDLFCIPWVDFERLRAQPPGPGRARPLATRCSPTCSSSRSARARRA